jgi:peptide/nickel transport system ATP-binding protein
VTRQAPVLELDRVSVRYRTRHAREGRSASAPATREVSLRVDAGQMLALVGQSGSGKTTVAHAALGLLDPRNAEVSGRVSVEGRDISSMSRRELRGLRGRVQLIYQDPYEALDPRMTVREHLREPLVIHRRLARGAEDAPLAALHEVGLGEDCLDRRPDELSGGQRQRVAVAAALVLRPRLLVADEPVSMLDTSVRAGILDLLGALRHAGLGVLMITHDLSGAVAYADELAIMCDGQIIERGSPRQVTKAPRCDYTRRLLSAIPTLDPAAYRAGA